MGVSGEAGGDGSPIDDADEAIRVLVVDDDPQVADLAATYLERKRDRFTVATETNADAVLERIADERVDAVVSDYDMPGRDGLELLEDVRGRYPDLPFMLFTGKGSEEIAGEAISSGVTDYLQKASGTEQYDLLANRVENAVARYRAERAVVEREERFTRLLEGSTDIIVVIDETGIIRYASPAVARVLGYDQDALVGTSAFEYVHPDDRESVVATFQDAVANPNQVPYVQYRFRHADGSWRWLESRGSDRIDQANLSGFIVNARDITERKQTEQRFQALVEDLPGMVSVLEPDGTLQYASPSHEHIIGIDPEAAVGENAFDRVHPDDLPAVQDAIETLEAGGDETVTVEVRYADRDGDWRWLEATCRDRTDDPAVGGIVVNARDITGQVTRERELERYEAMIDAIPDGVYTIDTAGRFTAVNDYVLERTGYDRADLLGEHVSMLIDEDDYAKGLQAVRTLLSSGDQTVASFEETIHTADGETIPTEARIALLTDEVGTVEGTVGVVRDLTERKERERQLERYETLVETVSDGVYALDETGRYTFVNSYVEELTGFDRDEIVGSHARDVLADRDVDRFEEAIAEMLRGDRAAAIFEIDLPTADGEAVPIEARITLLPYADEFRGTVGVLRDISDRQLREHTLQRQNERLEEFTSVVSHDLRNPLSVARGRLELARETGDHSHLAHADQALDRMEALIEDLLTLARDGRVVSDPEPVALAPVAEAAWATVATADADATLVVDAADTTVLADADRLRQVFENLLQNAVEHGGPGVTVRVGVLPDAGFFVADDGQGIPVDDRETVLDRGFSTVEDGTGFGLAIVADIVSAHGWELTVTDSTDGGARFEITGVETPE